MKDQLKDLVHEVKNYCITQRQAVLAANEYVDDKGYYVGTVLQDLAASMLEAQKELIEDLEKRCHKVGLIAAMFHAKCNRCNGGLSFFVNKRTKEEKLGCASQFCEESPLYNSWSYSTGMYCMEFDSSDVYHPAPVVAPV